MTTDQSDFLRIIDGIIETHAGEKIVGCFPPTREESIENKDVLTTLSFPLVAHVSYEVLLVRVFFYRDEWHCATRRKLDAFDSFWANPESIGAQFQTVVETIMGGEATWEFDTFLQSLNPTKNYFFLIPLLHRQLTGNITNPSNIFWLAGTQERGGEICLNVEDEPPNVWSLIPHKTYLSVEELVADVNKSYTGNGFTGLMIYSDQEFLRLLHPLYYQRLRIRNNESNIYKRALELMAEATRTRNRRDLDIFIHQHRKYLSDFISGINQLVNDVHRLYMARFVFKEQDGEQLSKAKYALLKKCHNYYKTTHNKVTQKVVNDILVNDFHYKVINQMLA